MRIACVYLHSFALQAHVRQAPFRANTAFAVMQKTSRGKALPSGASEVLVCSKAAWDLGIRACMSAAKVRSLAPEVELLAAEPDLYRRAMEALAESFLTLSLTVDVGSDKEDTELSPHRAIYVRVPKNSRGDSFGNKLLAQIDKQGYRARIGIADNRFSAWVAACETYEKKPSELFVEECTTIPRGGNAAFLAPKPIALLGLDEDVQQMLETLGIRSLGDFAELPPPSHGGRWVREGIDFRRLAQGEGPTFLHGFAPSGEVVESMFFESEIADTQALAFSLRPLTDRACDRLQGRGMAAANMILRFRGVDDEISEIHVDSQEPSLDGAHLLKSLHKALLEFVLPHSVICMELVISEECSPALEESTLLESQGQRPSDASVQVAIERLEQILDGKQHRHAHQQSFLLTGWSGAPMPKPARPARYRSSRRRDNASRPAQPLQVLLPL